MTDWVRADFLRGALSDPGIDADDTAMSSAELARLPAVSGGAKARITLYTTDPDDFEIVHVTAHSASATTATILRGQEDSTAQAWGTSSRWVQALTASEWDGVVEPGDLVVRAADYSTIEDAVADVVATAGAGKVLVSARTAAYEIETLAIGTTRVEIEIQAGATVRRPAISAETGPMILLDRNHAKVTGSGLVECLNDCPDGIIRVERVAGTAEWTRIRDLHLKGPGKTVTGGTGLVFAGNSTFQNRASGLTISDVDIGVRMEDGANVNHCTDLTLYNIGTKAYDFDSTVESTVVGGSVLASDNITVLTFRNVAQGVVVTGLIAEPGGTSYGYDIASGCLDVMLLGCFLNTSNRGTDSGTRTTIVGRRHAKIGDEFYIAGTRTWPLLRIAKSADEVVNNSTAYQADNHLTLAVEASATYELSGFIVYDAATAADAKFRLSLPASATAHWSMLGGATGITANTGSGTWGYLPDATGQSVGGAGVGTKLMARMMGTVVIAGTVGNVALEWAQATADATDLTVYATGSWLSLRRVA